MGGLFGASLLVFALSALVGFLRSRAHRISNSNSDNHEIAMSAAPISTVTTYPGSTPIGQQPVYSSPPLTPPPAYASAQAAPQYNMKPSAPYESYSAPVYPPPSDVVPVPFNPDPAPTPAKTSNPDPPPTSADADPATYNPFAQGEVAPYSDSTSNQ